MSYTEYKDLFHKAQNQGRYHMFVFDIKNSRSYWKNTGELAFVEQISKELILKIYKRLEKLQNERNKIILHKNKVFINIDDLHPFGASHREPFQFGDMFGFTVIRDSIDKEEIYQIFEEEKTKRNIYWDFHMMDGYYETDNYGEGFDKYYRGYCMQQLEELSKTKKHKL